MSCNGRGDKKMNSIAPIRNPFFHTNIEDNSLFTEGDKTILQRANGEKREPRLAKRAKTGR